MSVVSSLNRGSIVATFTFFLTIIGRYYSFGGCIVVVLYKFKGPYVSDRMFWVYDYITLAVRLYNIICLIIIIYRLRLSLIY